jgi:dienelactone hydrolase
VIDTLNADAALSSTNFVNAKKIGLWGHSMAGNVTLRAEAVHPDIPALVIWAGAGYSYEDLTKYKITDPSYDRSSTNTFNSGKRGQIRKLYGNPDLRKPFWHDMAATSFLTDIKGAIEVHQAVDDDVVNIGYSRDLKSILDKTVVSHEFYEYPTGGHNITDPSFEVAMQRTVDFYNKYLK